MLGYRDGPQIHHDKNAAYYRPRTDTVHLPPPERFESGHAYYATRFHELAHSTGHSKRLDRAFTAPLRPFGSLDYTKEELVAEMGAAFLAAAAGIGQETVEQSAAYIDGWRRKISADKKLVIQAAGAGQQAADFIIGTEDARPQRGSLHHPS